MWRKCWLPNSNRFGAFASMLIVVCAIFMASFGWKTYSYLFGTEPQNLAEREEKKFMNVVSGEFEVKVIPVDTGDVQLGMMTLDKVYKGDLQATGTGRMLTGMTNVKGSAAYVAIERVDGKLKGASGSFLVQHTGTMTKDKQSLLIRVVPDSGTGELAGIDGSMEIKIADGKHNYRFEYSLEEAK
jgi:Protein of unknown function (DUF3224)